MDNPTQYLKAYVVSHYPSLIMSSVSTGSRERVAQCWGYVRLPTGRWDFRLILPRSAPENALPLCTTVKKDNIEVWTFDDDHKMFQGLRQKFRVHFYELRQNHTSHFLLVEVLEGEPDRVTRIYRLDGADLLFELECLLKVQIAQRWGMKVHQEPFEKETLQRLFAPRRR